MRWISRIDTITRKLACLLRSVKFYFMLVKPKLFTIDYCCRVGNEKARCEAFSSSLDVIGGARVEGVLRALNWLNGVRW